MNSSHKNLPPKWATRFLHWYCSDQLVEDLEGDINEFYQRNVIEVGLRKAKFIYVMDVFKFFRPYTVQKLKTNNNMNNLLLFRNYFRTSIRNMIGNPLFSLINIVGLAISMSVALLLIAFLTETQKIDAFHQDADRVYRINNSHSYLGRLNDTRYASTSAITGLRMQESIAGIESLTIMRLIHRDSDFSNGDKTVPLSLLWASDEFFDVLSFEMIAGNPQTALKEMHSVVLTDESAKKLFGDESAMDKQLVLNDETYTVTGVVKKPPMHSHLKFEALGSYVTHAEAMKDHERFDSWTYMWSYYVYFKIEEGQDPEVIQSRLFQLSEEENSKVENYEFITYMQPLLAIMPGENLNNEIGSSMDTTMIWALVILSFVVVLSACFNYTNLSLARSMRRSLEVGVRKVNGASGFQVWLQFITESTVLSIIALIAASGLFVVLRSYFFTIDDSLDDLVTLQITPEIVTYFIGFSVLVGFAAGFFPAMFFSKLSVFKVLKDVSKVKILGKVNFRKVLILVQYVISLIFIVAVTLTYKQYRHALNFNLGYATDNILNIKLFGEDAQPLINDLQQIPEIQNISTSSMVTSLGSYWSEYTKYQDPLDSASVYHNRIDENYLPIHKHEFLAGGNFVKGSESDSAENNQIIVNEAFLKRFDMGTPEQALGELVTFGGEEKVIHGVLKNFHYGKVESRIRSFGFVYGRQKHEFLRGYVNLLVNTSDIFSTMNKIEKAWKEYDDVHPIRASFYNDQIKAAYDDNASMIAVIGVLAVLAITIASMGLLGMVVFTTETRLKEVSIRKVLGATDYNLLYLLGRGFMILLIVAAAIAIPVSYYFINSVVLADVAYKASFGVFDIGIGVLAVMLLALLAISFESLRAARSNPANILRSE